MESKLGRYAILYAEDSKIMQKIIRMMLRRLDCDPAVVEDGLTARKVLMSDNPPDIAILDWDMPGADGIDLCKEVKARTDGKFVYVIILTIHENKDAGLAYSCGADKFLSKDAGIEALNKCLEEAVFELESITST
ncbi:MAG: response regulator [Sedimentisphaerales bacterium]|nr:response regulator [Sedimentisphaerales bacterium]MBN2843475.1 response regulator [Sedimentisphaerales bacterium]